MVAQERIMKFNDRLLAWDRNIAGINGVLADIGFTGTIDEVAVMFGNKAAALGFIEAAVAAGGTLFNAASDAVGTSPIESKYLVDYLFLEAPGGRYYRIECMVIQQGLSPLHAGLRQGARVDAEPTVHYSFKSHSEEEYEETIGNFKGLDWALAQACVSTYGKFSYWLMPRRNWTKLAEAGLHEAGAAYIKPRVNLRDQPKGREHAPNMGQPYLSRKAI